MYYKIKKPAQDVSARQPFGFIRPYNGYHTFITGEIAKMIIHYVVQYFGLIMLGFVVSTYGTLIGAGGGFVLMPLLLLLYPHEDPHRLTAISLAVVLLNTLSGTAAYARMKRIDFKSGLIFAAATLPGAMFGVMTTASVSRQLFEGIFSIFLIGLALFMILKPKSDAPVRRESDHAPAAQGNKCVKQIANGMIFEYSYNRMLGIVVFFVLGFVASFFGIGGGSLIVPTLAYMLNFPVAIAAATSQFIVAILTCGATLSHLWIGSFHHGIHRIVALGIGMLTGAQLGAQLSNKIKGSWIIRSLAGALILVGFRMIFAAF
jgi:uncharacterized membrane protein YfcA